ncbi:uncharacterized protein CELE_ZK1053.2 [Caenorhabditis elegans]|uniref:Uncharacterized protein n=1 Tax=Caenorhabditis elegans TaxID=6239 RepID=O45994_CAEEL|nr:Uncharacterized protein CELE_ZK1053.2 [Caenorhabditis elegans]CAB04976.1 Uncharacterized protein CELE_ZK1053.2 [Caenorhabditis elegans]|eukprot:NP_493320.1 Uncharacterized protein CELE_ZK1053.2 [Caenorhabditis elegans]
MHFKHALITCLLVLSTTTIISAQIPENPVCQPTNQIGNATGAHFLYFLDKAIEPDLLSRLTYLLKAISCEIPSNEKIKNMIVSYSGDNQYFGEAVKSSQLPSSLYLPVKESSKPSSNPCDSFRQAIAKTPSEYLNHENVQFIVSVFGDATCFLKAFQSQFNGNSRKKSFFYNGILVNSNLTNSNNQSIRMVIPDLVKAINTSRVSLVGSDKINEVHESAHLVQSYASMIRDILLGNSVHDWEEILTTTLAPVTSTMPPTAKRAASIDDEGEMLTFDGSADEEVVIPPSNATNSTSTIAPTTHTILSSTTEVKTTRKQFKKIVPIPKPSKIPSRSSTARPTTTTEEYDADTEEDAEKLEMMSGKRKVDNGTTVYVPSDPDAQEGIDANILIYILLLVLLIWCFCIALCLIWMYVCAKQRKHKMISKAEEEREAMLALLEKGHETEHSSRRAKPSVSVESDEFDKEWKNIKPSKYTPASVSTNETKSELESVKQPVAATHVAPVEVSEFEERLDDDVDHKPRHGGYVKTKRTADLHFD